MCGCSPLTSSSGKPASAVDNALIPVGGKVYIKTFGCQMNEYDSAKIADVLLAEAGLSPVSYTHLRAHET